MKKMVYKPRIQKPKILLDTEEVGLRIIIISYGTHPCAYVGVPENHPIAGYDCDDLSFMNVHGGFTFSRKGDRKPLPKGYWWYGWDYAHCDDYMGYYKENEELAKNSKKWTTEEIYEEAKEVAWEMRKLMKFIEVIKTK